MNYSAARLEILAAVLVLQGDHQGFGRSHQTEHQHDGERQPQRQMQPDRQPVSDFGKESETDDDRTDQKNNEGNRAVAAVLAG